MQQLVDRYVPAYASNRQALEIIIRGVELGRPSFKKRWHLFRDLPYVQRRRLMRDIIKRHCENRRLYRQVLSGNFKRRH